MPSKFQNHLAAQNRITRTVNYAGGRGKIQVAYNASEDTPAEIMVCDEIGKDAWTGEGFSLKDLRDALADIPKTRALNFLTNSPGGSVSEGISIRNWLSEWEGEITNTVIGVAASAASWCIPAKNTRVYKNSQMFVHRAIGAVCGNVDDLTDSIEFLNKVDGQISQMYADQSGQTADEMLDLMCGKNGQGTLLTGQEAVDIGLADELIDGDAKNQFNAGWINSAKKKLNALNTLRATDGTAKKSAATATGNQSNKNQTIMNKEKMIALLNKWGVTIPTDATDEQLVNLVSAGKPETNADKLVAGSALNAVPADQLDAETKSLLASMKNQLATNRRKEIQNAVQTAATAGKIPVVEIENWVNDASAAVDNPTTGNPVLNRLEKLEGRAPGVPPIPEATNKIEASAEFSDIRKGFESFNAATASLLRGNSVPMKDIANASKAKARFTNKFRNRFIEAINANTIDPGLQRQFILQDVVIRDFKRRVLPLDLFGTVFRNVPLEGTDVVDVPYYDLDSTASQPYAGSYDALVSGTSSGVRPITVGWGPNKDGALGVGHCRLVQALSFSSQEIARQPYLKIAQLAALKAEKLAYDIFQDVLGVVTAANYPTLLTAGNFIKKSFDQFSSDDLADLKVACKLWPEAGRGLLIDSAYDGNLIKDPAFKSAYQIALDSVKAQGKLMPEMYGFQYNENPNIPANGINLRGLAFWKYAILVAFAPVPPVEEVRRAGTTWELITDEDGQVSLEYRTYGSNSADTATHVIESNYGFGPGLKTAIKPVVTP